MKRYQTCDMFVVMPPLTKNGCVIFGKNSNRPKKEVQEIIKVDGGLRTQSRLKCTYMTIDESMDPVNSVILSKPAWMWGAEMGANDKNVVIGNQAVWTRNTEGDGDAKKKRLLGMDLVRLGLERGDSAESALKVITTLLELYGQGGRCVQKRKNKHHYHNSFIIADPQQAWILETSGNIWAARRTTKGYINSSNGLSITTKIHKHCKNMHERAKAMGLWNGQSPFNFRKCFSSDTSDRRQRTVHKLLKEVSMEPQTFGVKDMMDLLRHKENFICRGREYKFRTQSSQVSILSRNSLNVHWFTGTPDPSLSYFKPFVFTPNAITSEDTICPDESEQGAHKLFKMHKKFVSNESKEEIMKILCEVEEGCMLEVDNVMNKFRDGNTSFEFLDHIMKNCVDAEIQLYS